MDMIVRILVVVVHSLMVAVVVSCGLFVSIICFDVLHLYLRV